MKRAYVDTNILLRFITAAPIEQAVQARELFAAAERGEIALILDEIIVAETVWVLSSFYKFSKKEIKEVLLPLLANGGIEVRKERDILLALTLFADMNVDFADALVSVHMDRTSVSDIVTFDKHFQRLPGVNRMSPKEFLAKN